jgi:hypothetical protein
VILIEGFTIGIFLGWLGSYLSAASRSLHRSASGSSGKVRPQCDSGKMYLIALAFNIVLFWLIRLAAVKYWPSWITRNSQYQWHIFFFGTQTITWVTHLSTILIFDAIDHFKLFYEYKVNKVNNPII